jgi:starch synthase
MIDGKLNVLFATSECVPLCKTGGLADVVGALPAALNAVDIKTRVIMPFYKQLPSEVKENAELIAEFNIDLGWRKQYVGLLTIKYKRRRYYFIDNAFYFDRDGLYGHFDDCERFVFFSLAVLESKKHITGVDVIHCNDWQTALIPTMLNHKYRDVYGYKTLKTVFTIHNLRFQGQMGFSDLISMLNVEDNAPWLWELYHNFQGNLLKSALYNADKVTTVSPTYAQEIKSLYYGEGMQDYVMDIENKLQGIINGLDVECFDPSADQGIYFKYNDLKGKMKNKAGFRAEFDLPDDSSMIVGMVTRLDSQKGLDLVVYAIHEMMKLDIQFVLLGTGDPKIEVQFKQIEDAYPDSARCFIMYDEKLAHKIYAACDVFLMPSKFEPCGLGQLIAMRYGALPIVRETGGLKDTVTPYNAVTGEGTGFSFANYNGDELLSMVSMASSVYKQKKKIFSAMATRAMDQDFSWTSPAQAYKEIYKDIRKRK